MQQDDLVQEKAQALQQAADLALQVLHLSRNTLLINLRFLDEALFRLTPIQVSPPATIATDGNTLFFAFDHVLRRFTSEKNAVTRDYLHMVLHCIYRHAFVSTLLDTRLWDLSVDIAVESTISSLGLACVATSRENRQQQTLAGLKTQTKVLTAEKLYHYFLTQNLSGPRIAELGDLFVADDHALWYQRGNQQTGSNSRQESKQQQGRESPQNTPQKDHTDDSSDLQERDDPSDGSNSSTGTKPSDDGKEADNNNEPSVGSLAAARAQLEQEWRDISQRIETDMETASKGQGTQAGGMMQQLRELNRERYDYTAFLKKFAVLGETMQVNDDEFDYIFYTYGLSLYGNMPLVEPLEYKEVKRIREFVIAIDTSGSTSGDLVQRFLQKTYNILKNTESFFFKINVHIIQCDAAIQDSVKITSLEEFDAYLKNLTIKGLGGTDFRPVFEYVDALLIGKAFNNLKGLIYFTDGMGTFPTKKPAYETAFLFIRDEYSDVAVPTWAIKLILEKDEI